MVPTTHLAFTICSNNYLGQALALKRSFLKHNPQFRLYIILVDKLSEKVDYTLFEPAIILPVKKVDGIDIDDLISRFYIIELNTCVKPSVFKHILNDHPGAEAIYYLDPDLYFYDSLQETNEILKIKTAVLTPHILSPIPRDGKMPDENIFLRFGIYNLGFLGINAKSNETLQLLDWWEERTLKFGYDRPHKGYFVDQLWMQYAPLFFEGVEVLKTYNYNMAPWNLHERRIEKLDNDAILLNDGTNLVFYHFSKISENDIDVSREYDRYTLNDFPLLKEMYIDYKQILRQCNFQEYKSIAIAYPVKMNLKKDPVKASLLQKALKKISRGISRLANKV
jgi:hypothetical protein